MGLEVATEKRTIEVTSQGGWTPSEPIYIETPAGVSKISEGKVLLKKINWTVTRCSFSGHTHISGWSVSPIMATSKKAKCDGQFVLRKNDSGTCQGTFVNNSSGATVPCVCSLKISDAGQTFVKGE